jgi:hypothetical protein
LVLFCKQIIGRYLANIHSVNKELEDIQPIHRALPASKKIKNEIRLAN